MAGRAKVRQLQSGALRQIGNIEKRVTGKDATGTPSVAYTLFAENVRFEIDDWKPYENVVAQAVERTISTRIRIRYRPEMSGAGPSQFRLVYCTNPGLSGPVFEYYDILGAVRDPLLRVDMVLTCALRDAAGFRTGATS
jgi:head-tail adaptor